MDKPHVHILGIAGTFMGGLAQLAQASGYTVSGCDKAIYPPMSDQLAQAGIEVMQGFEADQLTHDMDEFVIGNAMSRGVPVVEAILNQKLPYSSGPQWLYEHILANKWVIAVAGTHGKTSTSSMVAWILEYAGLNPGFLIGGVPEDFGVSARLTSSPFFVIEADEYDTAFFDKRSKFVHYRPRTLGLNNLEFDHADIFPDLAAIETQFNHLIRTVPGEGRIVVNGQDAALRRVLDRGCWTRTETTGLDRDAHWWAEAQDGGQQFDVYVDQQQASVSWSLMGQHNVRNALTAIGLTRHIGITPKVAAEALSQFKGIKRRMQVRGIVRDITVYDDFAHHPTAIETTLAGLRAVMDKAASGVFNGASGGRMVAVLEPRSNTMKLGIHNDQLWSVLAAADQAFVLEPASTSLPAATGTITKAGDLHDLLTQVIAYVEPGDHVVIMSNGAFGGLHEQLLQHLA